MTDVLYVVAGDHIRFITKLSVPCSRIGRIESLGENAEVGIRTGEGEKSRRKTWNQLADLGILFMNFPS
jgi:hypothetical protein